MNSSYQKNRSLGGSKSFYSGDQQQSQQATNPASLKGKVQGIEATIEEVDHELSLHKKELLLQQTEKDNLKQQFSLKSQENKQPLTNELMRFEDETKRHFAHQKAENNRLHQQIIGLNGDKIALKQQLVGLQKRIGELEVQVGNQEQN